MVDEAKVVRVCRVILTTTNYNVMIMHTSSDVFCCRWQNWNCSWSCPWNMEWRILRDRAI